MHYPLFPQLPVPKITTELLTLWELLLGVPLAEVLLLLLLLPPPPPHPVSAQIKAAKNM
jgi:hypothetical protein